MQASNLTRAELPIRTVPQYDGSIFIYSRSPRTSIQIVGEPPMDRRLVTLRIGLPVAIVAVAGFLMWYSSAPSRGAADQPVGKTVPAQTRAAGDLPLTTVPPPGTCGYCADNLVGKTADEVAQFASEFARVHFKAADTTQVLLTRAVTDDGLAALGLGCPPSFAAIEEPPLLLTILKGEFDFRGAFPGSRSLPPPAPGQSRYLVLLFD